jgi:hypothetical protein
MAITAKAAQQTLDMSEATDAELAYVLEVAKLAFRIRAPNPSGGM